MINWIQDNRIKMEHRYLNCDRREYLSPAYYGQYKVTLPLIQKYSRGCFIDLGCGDMPFRSYIDPLVKQYDSLDFFPRSDQVTFVSNIETMDIVPSNAYDSAICVEVLEHVPNPHLAVHEIYRVLKPGGVLVLTVPHLSRLHDLPYDYYRYTRFGLEHLLKSSGFTVLQVEERGGLLSFLGHQISLILMSIVTPVPVIREIVYWVNAWLVTRLSYALDRVFHLDQFFPLGYTVVAQK